MKRLISVLTVVSVLLTLFTACAKPLEKLSAAELLNLGNKYLLELKYDKAIVYFDRLIEVEPKNEKAYIGLADAYVGIGDVPKAIEVLQQGLGQLPNSELIKDKLYDVQKISNPDTEITENGETVSQEEPIPQNVLDLSDTIRTAFRAGDIDTVLGLLNNNDIVAYLDKLHNEKGYDVFHVYGDGDLRYLWFKPEVIPFVSANIQFDDFDESGSGVTYWAFYQHTDDNYSEYFRKVDVIGGVYTGVCEQFSYWNGNRSSTVGNVVDGLYQGTVTYGSSDYTNETFYKDGYPTDENTNRDVARPFKKENGEYKLT